MWGAPEDAIRNLFFFILYINDLPKSLDYSKKKGNFLIMQTPHFLAINVPFVTLSKQRTQKVYLFDSAKIK